MATHDDDIVNAMRKRVVELHHGKIVRDEREGIYLGAPLTQQGAIIVQDAFGNPAAAAHSPGVVGSAGTGDTK